MAVQTFCIRLKWANLRSGKLIFLFIPSLVALLYIVSSENTRQETRIPSNQPSVFRTTITNDSSIYSHRFMETDLNKRMNFSPSGLHDVLVFLHMQKTGGTFFGKNLVKNLKLSSPCECSKDDGMLKCPCMSSDKKRYWLFARYSVGWKCGLHADFTEISECLAAGKLDELEGAKRERKYHYISVIREPLQRYVSEWMHVSRGASWSRSTLRCNGRKAELPSCHPGEQWVNVTFEEFFGCPYNLARNRQTRMLANLSLIGCYSEDMMDDAGKKKLLLESAKENLRNMSYFGIIEYLNDSQFLFEWTFGLKFHNSLYKQMNRHDKHSADVLEGLTDSQRAMLLMANDLDVELYNYAKLLFFERLSYANRVIAAITP